MTTQRRCEASNPAWSIGNTQKGWMVQRLQNLLLHLRPLYLLLLLHRVDVAGTGAADEPEVKEAGKRSTEIIVVVEFLVLEDQSSLVEVVLSGRNGVVDGGTRGRAAHEGDRGRTDPGTYSHCIKKETELYAIVPDETIKPNRTQVQVKWTKPRPNLGQCGNSKLAGGGGVLLGITSVIMAEQWPLKMAYPWLCIWILTTSMQK
uniref:Uncharacterized protein n=1 Tax=Quercus lobata TaxID=97700 RepID=A0A7N2MHQ0_QUELO